MYAWVKSNCIYLLNVIFGFISINDWEHFLNIMLSIGHIIVILLGIVTWFEKRKKKDIPRNYFYKRERNFNNN